MDKAEAICSIAFRRMSGCKIQSQDEKFLFFQFKFSINKEARNVFLKFGIVLDSLVLLGACTNWTKYLFAAFVLKVFYQ